MNGQLLKGTGSLTKLLFRKDRIKILIWILSLVVVSLAAAAAYPTVYKTDEDLMAFALTMDNPAMVAMMGPGYALEEYTTATTFAHEMLLFTAIAVIVMNILIVGRATRADEEDGQLELVRSLPVGRLSYLGAAIIEMIIVNTMLALAIGFGLFALNLEGMTLESTLLYGSLLGGVGFVFAAITALFSQLAGTSRGATGLSFALLLIAYFIRAIGDIEAEALSMGSPLGWIIRGYVFAENEWWPVFLSLVVAIMAIGVSFYLNSIRDMGTGFIPARKGRSRASGFLKTIIGFIFRQQRMNIVAWAVGVFFLSASFGSIIGDMEKYFSDMELLKAFFGDNPGLSMTEQFLSYLLVIMSLFSAVPAVMVVLKLKGEESGNRTEHLYSRTVTRSLLMGNYFLVGMIVSFLVQSMIPIGLWSTGSVLKEMGLSFGELYGASVAYLPALWVYMAIAVLFVGWLPQFTNVIWVYFAFSFIVLYLKELLNFPDWLNGGSALEHVPEFLIEEGEMLPLILLFLLSALLFGAGLIGYRRRDIAG